MYTKMHNALVNHFLAVFFSIFQVFLVLLTHVVYRNFYYNKPWHERNGGILVGAVHSKPRAGFESCPCCNFSHFYESFSLQFSVAEWVCPSLAVLSKIKIFWCTKIPNNLLAQWLHWFCRKLRCWFLSPPESIFLNFYPIIFLVWAEPRKATNWTWAVLGQWAVAR